MNSKKHNKFLDERKIGTTFLEGADVPMGVVFGRIFFIDIFSGYNYIRNYCLDNKIELIANTQAEKLIETQSLAKLLIKNE